MRLTATLLSVLLLAGAAPSRAARKIDWKDLRKKGEIALEKGRKAADKGANIRDELHLGRDNERKLGREVAAHLIARFGLYEDEELTRYVNLVGRAIVRKSQRSDLPYRFGILNTRTVNAYAAPGGYIFVTRGLLQRLRNEAQLAGVLAHEIVHVDDKHAINGFIKGKALSLMAGELGKKSNFDKVAKSLIDGIVERGFSKGDEYNADRKGAELASRCRYHPAGLPASLRRLYGKQKTKQSASFHSRHPPLQSRLRKLDRVLKKLPNKGSILKRRFRKNVVFD